MSFSLVKKKREKRGGVGKKGFTERKGGCELREPQKKICKKKGENKATGEGRTAKTRKTFGCTEKIRRRGAGPFFRGLGALKNHRPEPAKNRISSGKGGG